MIEVKITRRNRNLGFGWSTTPTGKGTSIEMPKRPGVRGSAATVEREIAYMGEIVGTDTFCNTAMFVGSRRVIAVEGWVLDPGYEQATGIEHQEHGHIAPVHVQGLRGIRSVLADLEFSGKATVWVED